MSCASITAVQEGSTAVVTITILDENNDPAVPKTGVWTILDSSGAVIDGQKQIAISPLSSVMEVGLFGDDLPCGNQNKCQITFIFEGTYDTVINGIPVNDKPIRAELKFKVINITTIP
jgi:hypothetical protein